MQVQFQSEAPVRMLCLWTSGDNTRRAWGVPNECSFGFLSQKEAMGVRSRCFEDCQAFPEAKER